MIVSAFKCQREQSDVVDDVNGDDEMTFSRYRACFVLRHTEQQTRTYTAFHTDFELKFL